MNKATLFLYFLLTFHYFSFSQKTIYPKGAYATFEELKQMAPSIPYSFEIKKRPIEEIKKNGGNDYIPESNLVGRGKIKRKIFAISTGDTLFVNLGFLGFEPWYTKAIIDGKHLVLGAGVPSKALSQDISTSTFLYGMVGGIREEQYKRRQAANFRSLYVLDVTAEQFNNLDKKYLENLLEKFPTLKKQYLDELDEDKISKDTILKYMELINLN